MPTATPETLAALATIGLALAHGQTRAQIHRAIDAGLTRGPRGETWTSSEPSIREAFPSGLTMPEALGFTVALDWASALNEDAPTRLIAEDRGRWLVRIPTLPPGRTRELPPEKALELAQALLHIRRIVWPAQPWRLRDWVAEHIERQVRQIEASLRPPQRPEVITPYTAASDVGRAWS